MIRSTCFVSLFIVMFPVLGFANTDCSSFQCEQSVENCYNKKLVYVNAMFNTEWYELDSVSEKVGKIAAEKVDYIFWNKKYLGKVVALCDSDQVNETIRYFTKTYGDSHKQIKERSYQWITNDEIIIVRRFSLHLAQVEIYCKKYYEKWKASREPEN